MLYVNRKTSKYDLESMSSCKNRDRFSEMEQAEATAALKKWHSIEYGNYDVRKQIRIASLPKPLKIRIGLESYGDNVLQFRKKNPKATLDETVAYIDSLEHWNGNLQEWGKAHDFDNPRFKDYKETYTNASASIAILRAISKGNWKVDCEIQSVILMLLNEVLSLYKNHNISEDEVRYYLDRYNKHLTEDEYLDPLCRRFVCLPLDKPADLTDFSSYETKFRRDAVAKRLYRTKLLINAYSRFGTYQQWFNSSRIDSSDIIEACLVLADRAMETIAESF